MTSFSNNSRKIEKLKKQNKTKTVNNLYVKKLMLLFKSGNQQLVNRHFTFLCWKLLLSLYTSFSLTVVYIGY